MENLGNNVPQKKSNIDTLKIGLAAAAGLMAAGAAGEANAQQLNARPGDINTVGTAHLPHQYNRINQNPSVVTEIVRPDGSIVQVVDGRPQTMNEPTEAERARQAALRRLREQQRPPDDY